MTKVEREPSPELRARVLAEIAKTPSPPRHHARTRLVVAALAVAAVAVYLVTSRAHEDGGDRPRALVLATTLGAAVAAVLATQSASGRLPSDRASMLPPSAARLVGTGVLALAVLLGLAVLAAALGASGLDDGATSGAHLSCGALFVVQGVLPLAALLVPRVGLDPRRPALAGVAFGAAAGVWAAMMAWLRCPHVDLAHGILAHALPVLVLAAIGAAVGARVLRMR